MEPASQSIIANVSEVSKAIGKETGTFVGKNNQGMSIPLNKIAQSMAKQNKQQNSSVKNMKYDGDNAEMIEEQRNTNSLIERLLTQDARNWKNTHNSESLTETAKKIKTERKRNKK